MIRNQAGQSVGAQMINASTGADFTGTVTVYITVDGGVQTIGATGSGICTHEGKGFHTYTPTAAETNGALVACTFTGTGAITATVQYPTTTLAQAAAIAQVPLSGPLVYVSDLCRAALQRIGVLGAAEAGESEDLALALARLNALIDSWRTNKLFTFSLTRTTFTIMANDGVYTLGPTGDIAIERPAFAPQYIRLINTSTSPVQEMPIRVFTDAQYAAIPQKAQTSSWPIGVYYNPTAPLATLTFYPVPTASTLQGVIYTPNSNGTLALTDILQVPPGYRLFYQDNLALHLTSDFKVQPTQELRESARDAKADVKRANMRLTDLTVLTPFGPGGSYDIESDQVW